jgi:hypothetical protein
MKPAAITLLTCALLCGCSSDRLPKPYAGYTHSSAEHGYWREATDNKPRIGELHLHANGISVTYEPFETYKDYWGVYVLNANQENISLNVDGGNKLPTFSKASGKFSLSGDSLEIRGVSLDSRRPELKIFRFSRFHPSQ